MGGPLKEVGKLLPKAVKPRRCNQELKHFAKAAFSTMKPWRNAAKKVRKVNLKGHVKCPLCNKAF